MEGGTGRQQRNFQDSTTVDVEVAFLFQALPAAGVQGDCEIRSGSQIIFLLFPSWSKLSMSLLFPDLFQTLAVVKVKSSLCTCPNTILGIMFLPAPSLEVTKPKALRLGCHNTLV